MVLVKNLLVQFCCVPRKDTLRHFPCLAVQASSFKFQLYLDKTKEQIQKKFNWTTISWHLRKQVEMIPLKCRLAWSMISVSDVVDVVGVVTSQHNQRGWRGRCGWHGWCGQLDWQG